MTTSLLGLGQQGVATVGHIEAGLPIPGIPRIGPADVRALLPVALALAVLGYAETASVAQGFAARHRYDVDANKDLIALGGSNALAGLMRGFIVAGRRASRLSTIARARERRSRASRPRGWRW